MDFVISHLYAPINEVTVTVKPHEVKINVIEYVFYGLHHDGNIIDLATIEHNNLTNKLEYTQYTM
jgi:hypothetical protein